jgi:hypothetical protein
MFKQINYELTRIKYVANSKRLHYTNTSIELAYKCWWVFSNVITNITAHLNYVIPCLYEFIIP